MTQEENDLLSTPEVDKLVTLVEEATRATKDSPRRFIEPARGTLDRAKSRRHHIVFGRRGSGKTSLLRKAGADLTLQRIPMAFIDLEAFKGHEYPDVLLSILIETLNAFDQWLATAGSNPSTKTSFWMRLWGSKPSKPPLNAEKLKKVREMLSAEVTQLQALLHSEDKVEVTTQTGQTTRESLRQSEASRSGLTGEN